RRSESAGESLRSAGDEVPAEFFVEGSDGLVRRAGGSWRASGVVAVGVGHQGRSIWSGSGGDSPGMVFHVHVPEFEADSIEGFPYRWRADRNPGLRIGRSGVGAVAVS